MQAHTRNRLTLAGTALAALLVGLTLGRGCGGHTRHAQPPPADAGGATEWTCSMHPQIRQPAPGRCPLCGMDLIPAAGGGGAGAPGEREVEISPAAAARAGVELATVERRAVELQVRLTGKVAIDETRRRTVAARVPGRLERLFVDYTGIRVEAGDHMVELYSPELLAAQEELIGAARAAAAFNAGEAPGARERGASTLASAREKLRLWGLAPEQVEAIEQRGTAEDRITILAPIGGVVVEKNAQEGAYVDTGTMIYAIADLSQVWVLLDVYESDLWMLRYGQDVAFASEAWPGESIHGRIAFIDPLLQDMTRTIRVRVNVPNADGRLKPGMFVRAIVRAVPTADGSIAATDLAGKWISPMHPEIVKDGPGACDVCGMPLVPAETLGYGGSETPAGLPLVIPATAALRTGTRALVYVADPERPGVYAGREVTLGPRAGEDYIVRAGLWEGEQVVARGAFRVDSSVQLLGKQSLMQPRRDAGMNEANAAATALPPEDFRLDLATPVASYLEAQRALAADALEPARVALGQLAAILEATQPRGLPPATAADWEQTRAALQQAARRAATAADIDAVREAFAPVSEAMIDLNERFAPLRDEPLARMFCPMAFDDGARWLQEGRAVRNPYFGADMLECGALQTGPARR